MDPDTCLIGEIVYVLYAHMEGKVIGVEFPYPEDEDEPLLRIRLDDGDIAFARLAQITL